MVFFLYVVRGAYQSDSRSIGAIYSKWNSPPGKDLQSAHIRKFAGRKREELIRKHDAARPPERA
jgi:hypothetical protein